MIKVLIADDHAVVRTGLQLIFDSTEDIILAGEMDSSKGILDELKLDNYDLLILDVGIPGKAPLDVLSDVKEFFPHIPVIMFSMYAEEQYATQFLRRGASAYLNKERKPAILLEAIRTVVEGQIYYPPGQEKSIHISQPERAVDILTDRELQVLRLLAEGMSNDGISNKLCISKYTLSNHRNKILKKLKLSNNADLTRYAIRHGIIQ